MLLQTKKCSRCKQSKELSDFDYKRNSGTQTLSTCNKCRHNYREWAKENKKHRTEYMEKYKKENKDSISSSRASYYKDNKEHILHTNKEWVKNNKDKHDKYVKEYIKLNRKRKLKYIKEYRKTEKGKAVYTNSNFKRRMLVRDSDVTSDDIMRLKKSTNTCYWCGNSLSLKMPHIDHYIPLSKGGKHIMSNLVVSCEKCNLSKNAKDPIEFANSIGKLL